MESDLGRTFLDYSARKLEQLASRIEDCLARLTPEQVWARGAEAENAIGNLVLHLCGNVRQWIVCAVGGASDARRRDEEFSARGGADPARLTETLRAVMVEAAATLASLPPGTLGRTVRVQGYEVSVLAAIYHVVEHFSGHTGQIIIATKALTGADLGYYGHLRDAGEHGKMTP